MADSVVTVRDVFDLPRPGSVEESSPRWQSLREWINEDLAAAKSPGMEDFGSTIEELLRIPVSEIFITSWKDTEAIKDLLTESRQSPEAVTNVELADHTIKSKHNPHIEVHRKKATSKKIEFTLRLLFTLQGFSLKIQNGRIAEVRTGSCEMQGTFEYQGLAVVEKKNGPIDLPAVIAVNGEQKVDVKEPAPVHSAASATAQEPPLERKPIETVPPPPLIAPKLIATAAATPKIAEIIGPALPPRTTEKGLSSPDFSSLIPPRKITPQKSEPASLPEVIDTPCGLGPTETADQEEEREVFVL